MTTTQTSPDTCQDCTHWKQFGFALAAGLLFALGLVVSGMTQPAKVQGFLNLLGLKNGVSWNAAAGMWDPSLALVMGGALAVMLVAFATTLKRQAPWADKQFHLSNATVIDKKLVVGSALFGIGWGLAGYCPGPAIASLLTAGADALIFCVGMFGAMWVTKTWGK